MTFTGIGALIGLAAAILLIIWKLPPAYSLIAGAILGGLAGGGSIQTVISAMIDGAGGMMPSVLRIMTSGILAGALIETGAAEKIADTMVRKLGRRHALTAIAAASMLICAVGVFADIAVITVAPVALTMAERTGHSRSAVLLASIGGCKAGNILSPNPNTIAAAESFGIDMTALMIENIVPALMALLCTILLSNLIGRRCIPAAPTCTDGKDAPEQKKALPGLIVSLIGPVVVVVLLMLRPLADITVDPLIALPVGGLLCIFATGNIKRTMKICALGLEKIIGVSVLLIGTGALAGIIRASALQGDMIRLLDVLHLPAFVLAPIAGIFLGAAASSTTAGATIASQTFAGPLTDAGIPAVSAAAMIHAGATVLDSLPHGSFFHATGNAVGMSFGERMKLIPYEAMIGMTSTVGSVIWYLIVR